MLWRGAQPAMSHSQIMADKTAIGLSLLCALHCLALPLLVVFLPATVAVRLGGEAFHYWMVFTVIPVSAFALTLGCRRHGRYAIVLVGASGLGILCLSVAIGHEALGEVREKALTLLGASLIALGHLWNYRLCRQRERCECPPPVGER